MPIKKEVSLITWVNIITIAWFVSTILLILLSTFLEMMGVENLSFITGLSFGFGVSTAEWLVLKQHKISFRWIILGSLGMALPYLIKAILKIDFSGINEFLELPILIGAGALITGFSQYSLLKAYDCSMGKTVQFTLMSWIVPVFMVTGASAIPKGDIPNIVIFLINLLAILGAGPVYAIFKYQLLRSLIEPKPTDIVA